MTTMEKREEEEKGAFPPLKKSGPAPPVARKGEKEKTKTKEKGQERIRNNLAFL